MGERELTRSREPEAKAVDFYQSIYELNEKKRARANEGKIVIKGNEHPWETTRQAILKHFLHPFITDTALGGWLFFIQDIRTRSGKHRHQGGLALYVIEGKGWTVVDGVRYDWEEGDLILLPVKPRGCEHQHFNAEPGTPCKWLAMIHVPWDDALGNEMEQREASPLWKEG